MAMTPPNPPTEVPFDPANQSLADALRTSFRILKFAIVVLVILFVASGSFVVEQNEQAIVLRLGELHGPVRDPGFHWALPAPIDEVVRIPVKQSNTLAVDSHWMHLKENEKTLPLSQIRRGRQGLHPVRDGALLTADRGLVHIKWRLTYRIDDMGRYVALIADAQVDKLEDIVTKLLENAAIHVASTFTTEDATRKRLSELREDVKLALNRRLDVLGAGIVVESVEIPESTPPLQTRLAFDDVIRKENEKQTTIREAEQAARKMLNETAGAVHGEIIAKLDAYDLARAMGDAERAQRALAEVDRLIVDEASGQVGEMMRAANGYYTSVVQQMRSDAERYEALVDEYRANPDLLVTRLWEETKRRLFANPRITKVYRPADATFRIRLGVDPKKRQEQETREYMKQTQDAELPPMEPKYPGGPLTVP